MISLLYCREKPMILKNDHHYPGSAGRPVVAILYGDFSSEAFKPYHNTLRKLAQDGKVDYIMRHFIKVRVKRKYSCIDNIYGAYLSYAL